VDIVEIQKPIGDKRDKDNGLHSVKLSKDGSGLIECFPCVAHDHRDRAQTDFIQALCNRALKKDGTVDGALVCDEILQEYQTIATQMTDDLKSNKETLIQQRFLKFPGGIYCNNELFNTDKKGNKPKDMWKVVTNLSFTKDDVGFDKKSKTKLVSLKPFLVWTLAVDDENDRLCRTTETVEDQTEDELVDAMHAFGFDLNAGGDDGMDD
jgi:hypothetical protein